MLEELTNDDPRMMGSYRLAGRLGSGSFGTVYAAQLDDAQYQTGEKDPAAVKVAHDVFSDIADFSDRFNGEIDAIMRVRSEYVPRFIEAEVDGSPAWLATELIPGLSLDAIISSSAPLGGQAVWQLGAGLIEALSAIHAAGCLHRDFRPNNVMVSLAGPWLVDFSLASLADDLQQRRTFMKPRSDHECMSPEEMDGGIQATQEPADVFGLAGTLVFAATGRPLLRSPADAQAGRYNLAGLPKSLRDQIEGCLHRDPRHRVPLERLKDEFARQAHSPARDGLTALLSQDVIDRLVKHQAKLIEALSVDNPERLGWREPRRISPGAKKIGGQGRPQRGLGAAAGAGVGDSGGPPPPAWTSLRLGGWISGPVAVREDKVVLACLDGSVAVLSAIDGKPVWRKPLDVGSALHAGALLDRQGEGPLCAYVGAADGRLHSVDLTSRRARVLLEAEAPIEGTPVMAGDRLCALSGDGRVHTVHLATGEQRVLFQLGVPAAGVLSATTDTIYASGADGGIRSIDANTGQLNWHFATEGLVVAKPIVVGKSLYVGGTDRVLRKINVDDGHEQHSSPLPAPVHTALTRFGHRLYVASSDGVVHAYDIGPRSSTGLEKLWPHQLGGEIAGLTATAGGRIYAAVGRRLVELTEVDKHTRRERELLSLDSLIAAPPTISGDRCYIASLGGVTTCLLLS